MAKVNLEDIVLDISPLTGQIYIGVVDKDEMAWIQKRDMTLRFNNVVVKRFGRNNPKLSNIVHFSGKHYQVEVRELSPGVINTVEEGQSQKAHPEG